jgi:hypothetical protein
MTLAAARRAATEWRKTRTRVWPTGQAAIRLDYGRARAPGGRMSSNFIEELRSRQVFRAAAMYLVSSCSCWASRWPWSSPGSMT